MICLYGALRCRATDEAYRIYVHTMNVYNNKFSIPRTNVVRYLVVAPKKQIKNVHRSPLKLPIFLKKCFEKR